jgi:hypothetical protein
MYSTNLLALYYYITRLNETQWDSEWLIGNTVSHLFTVSEESEKLNELFHHIMAKLLFLCKHGQPNIQTAVAFLGTQVKAPDKDDYKKLWLQEAMSSDDKLFT